MADQNAETKQVRIQKNGVGAGVLATLARHYGVPESTVLDATLNWLGQSLGLGLAICEEEGCPEARAQAFENPKGWSIGRWSLGIEMADRLSRSVVDEKAVTWDPEAASVVPDGLIKEIEVKAKKWRMEKRDRARAAAAAPRRPRGSVKQSTERKKES